MAPGLQHGWLQPSGPPRQHQEPFEALRGASATSEGEAMNRNVFEALMEAQFVVSFFGFAAIMVLMVPHPRRLS